jgi:hypothetical protein
VYGEAGKLVPSLSPMNSYDNCQVRVEMASAISAILVVAVR